MSRAPSASGQLFPLEPTWRAPGGPERVRVEVLAGLGFTSIRRARLWAAFRNVTRSSPFS